MPLRDKIFYVYILFRPWDGTPCYVGKGKGRRFRFHARKGKFHNNYHLANIFYKAGDKEVPVVVCDGLTESEAIESEIAFIKAIGRGPGLLANMTDGGDGVANIDEKSAKARREKISAYNRAVFSDPIEGSRRRQLLSERIKAWFANPEHRKILSEILRSTFDDPVLGPKLKQAQSDKITAYFKTKEGRKRAEEHAVQEKARWSNQEKREAQSKRIQTFFETEEGHKRATDHSNWLKSYYENNQEARKRFSQSQKGVKQTPERIANRVAKNTGKKRTEEFKQHMRAVRLGKKASAETRSKISEANRRRVRKEESKEKARITIMERYSPEYLSAIGKIGAEARWSKKNSS